MIKFSKIIWLVSAVRVLGVAVIGIGTSAIYGHIYSLKRFYNWNNADAAMGLSSAVAFSLIGLALIILTMRFTKIERLSY